mmetsp:Transcript_19539/g.46197  ORF Transcript_19539/g.46197 Transcript_19539/m.46197 type:complete len:249 (-) Transcript_19539:360-1106(-)
MVSLGRSGKEVAHRISDLGEGNLRLHAAASIVRASVTSGGGGTSGHDGRHGARGLVNDGLVLDGGCDRAQTGQEERALRLGAHGLRSAGAAALLGVDDDISSGRGGSGGSGLGGRRLAQDDGVQVAPEGEAEGGLGRDGRRRALLGSGRGDGSTVGIKVRGTSDTAEAGQAVGDGEVGIVDVLVGGNRGDGGLVEAGQDGGRQTVGSGGGRGLALFGLALLRLLLLDDRHGKVINIVLINVFFLHGLR